MNKDFLALLKGAIFVGFLAAAAIFIVTTLP